jgi:predicted DNA-binding transcriptional regulator AlpA
MQIPERYRVMSATELGEYLGYTTATIYTHLSRGRYDKVPPPSERLGSGPIWYVGSVVEWRSERRS